MADPTAPTAEFCFPDPGNSRWASKSPDEPNELPPASPSHDAEGAGQRKMQVPAAAALFDDEGGGGAGPQLRTARDGWDLTRFISGIEAEEDAPAHVIAKALAGVRPREFGDDLAWCRHLSTDRAKLRALLIAPTLIDSLADGLGRQMSALAEQAAATSKELNEKFVADSGAELSFGERRLFDDGLEAWIGVPNQAAPLEEMWREHNEHSYVREKFCAGNYGIETDPIREWIAAAGEWTPQRKSHAIKKGFSLPRESKNIEAEHMREMICLDEFIRAPDEAERRQWEAEGEVDLERLPQQEQARRRVHLAGLSAAEVLALRLWSGPMYYPYNSVLRSGIRGKFTTVLHVLVSAIIKLARIGTPEVVYRGMSGRSIVLDDFERGFFVEKGAQSFTRDKSVAQKYASWGREGAASYLVEVREGWADQGADISVFSYYPYEKEKLYGPLVLMQLMSSSVERSTVKLKMRLNINLHDGTLDEAISARKRSIVSRERFLRHSCQEGWDAIKSALAVDKVPRSRQADWGAGFINSALNAVSMDENRLEDAEKSFEMRKVKEELLLKNMFQQLERQEAEWFNDDANYKSALNDAIDFRKHSISRLVMSVLDDKRRQADNAEKFICQPKVKDVCFIHQASYDRVESMEHQTGDLAVAAFNAVSMDENPNDIATVACEPCESNYPLYETKQAGLENVAQCMKRLKIGFREDMVARAERLVLEERRRRLSDMVTLSLTFFAFASFTAIGCVWAFLRSIDGWILVALFFLRCVPEVLTSSLRIHVLKIQPPTGFVPYAMWLFRSKMGLYSLTLLYMVFQSLRMWVRVRHSDDDYLEFPFAYDWMEFPLFFGFFIPFVNFPFHLAVRQISLTEWARNNVPSLLQYSSYLFTVSYPLGFYVVWIGLFCGAQSDENGCYWPTGRLDHSKIDHSIGWVLVCWWWGVHGFLTVVLSCRKKCTSRASGSSHGSTQVSWSV